MYVKIRLFLGGKSESFFFMSSFCLYLLFFLYFFYLCILIYQEQARNTWEGKKKGKRKAI